MRAHFSRSAARRRISRPPSPLHSLATLRAAISPATACMVGRGSHTNFENARQLLSAISSTRASLRGASGLPLSQCRGTRPQSRLPQMPSHRLRRRRQRGNHRAGPSPSSITLRLPAAPRSHRRRRRSGSPQLARPALSPLSPRSSACTRTAQTPPRRPPTGTSLAGRSWPAGGGALLRRSPLQQASIAAAVSAWKSLTRSQAELAWTRR